MSRFEVLRELGLSKAGIKCYVHLLEHGPATTRKMAQRLKMPQTNLYGVLESLVSQGFVSESKLTVRPTLFAARPLNHALREYYMNRRVLVLPLCRELGVPLPPALPPAPPQVGSRRRQ